MKYSRALKFFFFQHWIALVVVCSFLLLELSVIQWGIPSPTRVFLYHMDEWHQLMAVKAVKENFSTTVDGAAHGTMFHFLFSGGWLLVFSLLKIINPESVTHPVASLFEQEKIFVILRLSTIVFGVGTILILNSILKNCLK